MAASTDPGSVDHGEQLLLRLVVAGVCAWELAGLASHHLPQLKVPTISASMWRLPVMKRAVVWGAAALVLTDHFITRRWT